MLRYWHRLEHNDISTSCGIGSVNGSIENKGGVQICAYWMGRIQWNCLGGESWCVSSEGNMLDVR